MIAAGEFPICNLEFHHPTVLLEGGLERIMGMSPSILSISQLSESLARRRSILRSVARMSGCDGFLRTFADLCARTLEFTDFLPPFLDGNFLTSKPFRTVSLTSLSTDLIEPNHIDFIPLVLYILFSIIFLILLYLKNNSISRDSR